MYDLQVIDAWKSSFLDKIKFLSEGTQNNSYLS